MPAHILFPALPDLGFFTPVLAIGVVVVLGAGLCACLIVVLLPLFQRYALARPNARSSHVIPTPQGGGLAVIVASLSLFFILDTVLNPAPLTLSLFVVIGAALLLLCLGGVDDIKPLPALPRFLLQTLLIGLVLSFPQQEGRLLPDMVPLWGEKTLIALALLWFVNLVNFMDGIDLITSAQMIPLWGLIATTALLHQDLAFTLFSLCLIGALLGFVGFNWPPARLFLGDMGSLPLGLLSGWALVQIAAQTSIAVAIIPVLYYGTDATLTLGQRLRRREKIWLAHRSHAYQRACQNGQSGLSVVARIGATNSLLAILAGLALWIRQDHTHPLLIDSAALGLACILVWVLLKSLNARAVVH